MTRTDQAVAHFENGFNCAQAVLLAFAPDAKLEAETAARLASGFGGGMGRMGLTCGAVTGAFMVLGLQHGAATPDDKQAKEATYERVREFARRFRARNGSLECRDLLGCDISVPAGLADATRKGVFASLCPCLVRSAVEILEELA